MGLLYPQLRKIISASASTLRRLGSEQSQLLVQTVVIAGTTGMILTLVGLALSQLKRQISPAQLQLVIVN
ncbi:hypothetical protein ASD67_11485 [Sphingopyxis sp. Root1497]|uniref:hypothetical protein n=1 Tax=Sphingopyxis sp. Root1497 TaxID=1736474 RepID=UPI0006F796F0|nr:hypothetical protein [Sphingopyxis sp. Root1497]KQZ65010.1 hypothetical protein ASD67_11485 [Sphingopyxis sp. Root1497]